MPFLAVPACISFGLHRDTHRFLVFPELGRSLQSILDDRPNNVLTEKTVLHLLFRLVDALEFIHENEYVHGNISAESIFVNPDTPGQVTLAGYSFVFRYCPGSKHVAYVEQKRAAHQGPLEFISLDLHKGVDHRVSVMETSEATCCDPGWKKRHPGRGSAFLLGQLGDGSDS
ncbi:inactive serine/threonine-protein kinase VRK3-like [Vombatus ursinus]|uniref:inactive serine/threonine-protein kinase VRK3-like n=1 Tax=Vombatus ursinus TaxID=29139 RepID=UPI000FFCFB7C|nr:inactive serine/threonine-protein kinase VRK3-like [Vombatus ursinus]